MALRSCSHELDFSAFVSFLFFHSSFLTTEAKLLLFLDEMAAMNSSLHYF